jgi:hypothetical protein
MKFFLTLSIVFPLLSFSQDKNDLNLYQKMILKHAQFLSDYREGAVFLKKMEEDTLWARGGSGDVSWSFPCSGKSELKSTILLSGDDDDEHYGLAKDERYYVLEETTFWLDESKPEFENCKNHFGSKIPKEREIYLRNKNRISLLDFKKIFREKIYDIIILDDNRVKLIIGNNFYPTPNTYCGPRIDPVTLDSSKKIVKKSNQRVEITLDLSRPWEFSLESLISRSGENIIFFWERVRLPDVNPIELNQQIKDVEVNLGTYSYLVTEGCKREFDFPKKKWKDIINWRSFRKVKN